MEKKDEDSGTCDRKKTSKESTKISTERYVQSLVHACRCTDANCTLLGCHKWKKVIHHAKNCKRKENGRCPSCKQLAIRCCYHARFCLVDKCPVPFCTDAKSKLRQPRIQQMIKRAQALRRHKSLERSMSGMVPQTGPVSSSSVPSSGTSSPQPQKQSCDFDSGASGIDKTGLNHEMENFDLGLDSHSSTSDEEQTNPRKTKKLSIQSLVHACQCRGADCRLPDCVKMKKVVQHARSCVGKTNGSCPVCKQLIKLSRSHAKNCKRAKCSVPFCLNIKQKLHQKQLNQRLKEARAVQQRIATMQNRGMSGAPQQPSTSAPAGVLQVVQQVQAAAARQTIPLMITTNGNYGNVNLIFAPADSNMALVTLLQQMQEPMP